MKYFVSCLFSKIGSYFCQLKSNQKIFLLGQFSWSRIYIWLAEKQCAKKKRSLQQDVRTHLQCTLHSQLNDSFRKHFRTTLHVHKCNSPHKWVTSRNPTSALILIKWVAEAISNSQHVWIRDFWELFVIVWVILNMEWGRRRLKLLE